MSYKKNLALSVSRRWASHTIMARCASPQCGAIPPAERNLHPLPSHQLVLFTQRSYISLLTQVEVCIRCISSLEPRSSLMIP
jgi:hypothetical protein